MKIKKSLIIEMTEVFRELHERAKEITTKQEQNLTNLINEILK